ncbi:hypothetical protein KKG31_02345 [Patescibacteria group bacterium]|nr:hypothetical protein [Patescibacteria group bacterium]
MTWNRLYRAYDCILSATGLMGSGGLGLDSNQILLVMITGADNVNYASTNNTGYDDFLLNITDIDNTPPYITGSQYYWTGAFTGTDNYT